MSVKYNYSAIEVAVVGCGNWGKNLIRVYHELGVLRAVCDTDPHKMTYFKEILEVDAISFNELLASTIDAIVIATPSVTHFELARKALLAKKHVFLEKPITHHTEQVLQLQQLANENHCCLMVGHLLQYHPAFLKLKTLNAEGVLGDLQSIHTTRLNFGKFPTEQNVLWDYAPHDISMILGLMQCLPIKVFAAKENPLSHTTADTTTIHLQFADNKKARVISSWVHPFKEQKLIVTGSKAMAMLDDCQAWDNKLTLLNYPKAWDDGLPHPFRVESTPIPLLPAEPLKNECEHFLQAILTQSEPITGANEALNVTTVLAAAIQSIASEQTITIKEKQQRTTILEGIYA